MKLFVTGATGFIGSHFLRAALADGHQIVALRRSPASAPRLTLTREPEWIDRPLAAVSAEDLGGCEVLVHLASPGVSPQKASWDELIFANVYATTRLVETAHAAGVRRVVTAGTSLEYGASGERYERIPPDAPLEPTTLYGASKAAGFLALSGYARSVALEFYYGRVFSAYGIGQFKENFWPSLRRTALAGEDFPMTSGRQIRDFIPVEGVANTFLSACVRPDFVPGRPCVENIGSGHSMTISEFAAAEWTRLRAKGRLLVGARPDRPNEVYRLVPLVPSTTLHP